jgi:hypothetical protein
MTSTNGRVGGVRKEVDYQKQFRVNNACPHMGLCVRIGLLPRM